jgi:hypothetical protein
LPEVIRLVQSLTAHVSDVDVSVLADVIQKDPVILAKVLATAQTLGFNATGAQVGSVAQAIHIIGYARLRSLTLSYLIAQGAERAGEEQRGAAALAVCSGFIAQAAAHQYYICDPEEAFIFACLRHFGRLVLAGIMPLEYRRAMSLGPETEAGCRQVFGLTALDFGRELLAEENVPPPVLQTMRRWGQPYQPAEEDVPDRLVALCDFSGRLAETCLSEPAFGAEAAVADAIAGIAGPYEPALPDLSALAGPIVSQAGVQLRRFLLDRGITSLPPAMVRRFYRRAEETKRPGASALAQEMPVVLGRDEAIARVLESFEARDVAVFARAPDGSETFVLAGGSGPFYRTLFPGLTVQAGERTVAGLCLRRCENILIHDARDPKMAGHLPEWLARVNAPGAFALFPALGPSGPRALLLVAWSKPRRIAPPPGFAPTLSALLTCMAERSAA